MPLNLEVIAPESSQGENEHAVRQIEIFDPIPFEHTGTPLSVHTRKMNSSVVQKHP